MHHRHELRNIRAAVFSSRKVFDLDAIFYCASFNNLEACQKLKIPTKFSLYVVFSCAGSIICLLVVSHCTHCVTDWSFSSRVSDLDCNLFPHSIACLLSCQDSCLDSLRVSSRVSSHESCIETRFARD